MKELNPVGGHAPGTPPRSANDKSYLPWTQTFYLSVIYSILDDTKWVAIIISVAVASAILSAIITRCVMVKLLKKKPEKQMDFDPPNDRPNTGLSLVPFTERNDNFYFPNFQGLFSMGKRISHC